MSLVPIYCYQANTIKKFLYVCPLDVDWPEVLCNRLTEAHKSGQRLHIIIVSEGAIDKLGKTITSEEIRKVRNLMS